MKYLEPKFTVVLQSEKYSDAWERIFGEKQMKEKTVGDYLDYLASIGKTSGTFEEKDFEAWKLESASK